MINISRSQKVLILLCVLITAFFTIIVISVVKSNNIKSVDNEIETVYTAFENTDDRTEKYNILTDFIADSENYSKYQENEKNYQSKISEMKKYFVVSYENLIEENSINISDETTKEELSTAISHLNKVKKTINSNKIIQIEDFISEIDSKIQNYKTKIAEIEAAEKAEEERLRKEAEEKAIKEAEEAAKKAEAERLKKEAEEKVKKQENAESKNNSNKTNDNSCNTSTPIFNPNGKWRSHWFVDEEGNEIPGTRTYHDDYGNAWDENYNYIGNVIEDWGI